MSFEIKLNWLFIEGHAACEVAADFFRDQLIEPRELFPPWRSRDDAANKNLDGVYDS